MLVKKREKKQFLKMNFVGHLQEYCVANGLSLPEYKPQIVGGVQHAPLFSATVSVGNRTWSTPSTELQRRAVDAKQKAAEIALRSLEGPHTIGLSRKEADIFVLDEPYVESAQSKRDGSIRPRMVLLDGGNVTFAALTREQVASADDVAIWLFVQADHAQLWQTHAGQVRPTQTHSVRSRRRDAVDVSMTISATKLMSDDRVRQVVLVSGDHYVDSVVDVLQEIPGRGSDGSVRITAVHTIADALRELQVPY